MKKSEAIFASIVLVLGVGFLEMALNMPRGKLARPGPGFYPTIVGVLLVVLTAVYLLLGIIKGIQAEQAAADQNAGKARQTGFAGIPASALLAGILAFFNIAMYYLGYLVALTALLLLSVRIFGYKKWWGTLLISGLTVGIAYITFVKWLAVPLPKGYLWDLLT